MADTSSKNEIKLGTTASRRVERIMLSGALLGSAIEQARAKKGVTKKAMAEHFGVSQPSVQDWVKRGTIDKSRLDALWSYFADVVDMSHWGISVQQPTHRGTIKAEETQSRNSQELDHALQVVLDALDRCPARAELKALLPLLVTRAPEYRQRLADLLSGG